MVINTRKAEDITIVFVKSQFEYSWLIKEGRKISDAANTKLYVVNVQQKCLWGKKFCMELQYLCNISKKLGAEMLVFFSDDVDSILKDCIERNSVKHVVFGKSNKKSINLADLLYEKSNEFRVHILSINDKGAM